MNRFYYLLVFFSVLNISLTAQGIGDWRMHINYNSSIDAGISPTRVISANEKSLLEYDLLDGSIRVLDKDKGLSDFGVNSIAYDELTDAFVVAYSNSNVDLIKGNTIINVPDIKNNLSAGSKNINDIICIEGKAYLSTDFGIVVLDIENEEIDNTYIIGSTGNQTVVSDCAIFQDTIYAITQEGMKRAATNSPNLLDYSEWEHNFSPFPNATDVEAFEDDLFILSEGFYKYSAGNWDTIFTDSSSLFKKLIASEILTFIVNNINVLQYQNDSVDTLTTGFLIDPTFCMLKDGRTFYGDLKKGLYQNNIKITTASSPFTNQGFDAISIGEKMAITAGGFNKNLDGEGDVESGFYIFENNTWVNHNIYATLGLDEETQDLNYQAYNPVNNKLYIAMLEGLIEYDFSKAKVYNPTNSPLEPYLIANLCYTTGVQVDDEGNVWMVNPGTSAGLKVLSLDGTWHSFVTGVDDKKLSKLFIDSYNQKWFTQKDKGLYVFKEGDDLSSIGQQVLALNTSANQGNLPNINVNTIVEDKDGQIWVGTDEGIALFSCPEGIFDATTGCRESDRITNTLDIYTEYLFETDQVNVIEVDGANRKWFGTSAGVFLLSADGKTEIHRFNTENSPLPSNNINDIEVDEKTGEVFILTDNGMVSYFSDATEGAENHDEIKAFPNPVYPNFTGFISITGLVTDAFVKITDEHGVLVDEGFALGGKYVWDGNDYNGNRVNSGVYYVFSANSDASEKAATKIAFVK